MRALLINLPPWTRNTQYEFGLGRGVSSVSLIAEAAIPLAGRSQPGAPLNNRLRRNRLFCPGSDSALKGKGVKAFNILCA